MPYKDYYQILGVDKTATPEHIKKAYRRLARQYHPDVSKEADAAQRMAEINEAHAVLGDAEKRAAYDRVGPQAWAAGARSPDDMRPPPGWSGPGAGADASGFAHTFSDADGYSDFFEHLFGEQARQRARAASQQPLRGADQHARVELSLADAYHGAERHIHLRGVPGQADERTLQVKIPKGVKEGQMIRLAGRGSPGLNGGPPGDLYLQVQLRPDPRWQVDGRDVTQTLRVTPWEAALGASVPVHTPDGHTLEVSVPAGSGAGRKLRLKGRGIPSASAPGDLFLALEIAVPGAATAAQQAAWQALADAYPGFDPRRA